MVSFVIVSHSEKFAIGVIDLARMSAPNVTMLPAGGLPDGGYGTSFELISSAIEKAYSPDGVIVFIDMGSAVMTTEMVIESLNLEKVKMVDCPIVDGVITSTVLAESGASFEEIINELENL